MTRKFIRMCEPIFFEYRFVKQVLDILTVIVSFSSSLWEIKMYGWRVKELQYVGKVGGFQVKIVIVFWLFDGILSLLYLQGL